MTAIDFAGINRAALCRGRSLVQELVAGGKFRSYEYIVRNPRRHDKTPGSFKINYKTGQWADFADAGVRGTDLISLVAYLRGCSQVDAARELAAMVGAPAPKPADAPNEPAITVIMPVPADAPPALVTHPTFGNPSRRWTYLDASGATLGYVLRFDRDGAKEFLPLTLCSFDSKLLWRWKSWPTPRPLYGLDKLAERPAAPVVVCEGEKSADAAAQLLPDFVAVTSPNGSKSADKADWSPLKRRAVTVWPDADQPGLDYAQKVAELAAAAGALSVAIASPPADVNQGWDAADALAEGWDQARAEGLIATAEEQNAGSQTESCDTSDEIDAEIKRLASLSPIQYERERQSAADRLEVRTSVLDALVKAAQPQDTKGQGRAFELFDTEQWPDTVNGAELLDEISKAILEYVVMPTETADALALWAVHTHCFECFEITPRAAITSPEKQCGKTTTLDVLECLVERPLPTSNATVSAIFRTVEMAKPALLIDEADTFLKNNDELRGILNTGYRRGGQVLRTVGDDHEPRMFSTWAPAAIAMIGRLPDTLNDRSIAVRLRRRKPSEKIKSFRKSRTEHLAELARKATRWAKDHETELAAADPDMGELFNRVADNWRPLFAIAEALGGNWPKRVREIARIAVAAANDESIAATLFADIKWIFDGCPEPDENGKTVPTTTVTDRLSSARIVEHLAGIEGHPWAEWISGKPISAARLARLLGKFDILSGTIRVGDKTAKGYYRIAFEDAFTRYIPPPPEKSVTASQLNSDGHCDAFKKVTADSDVTLSKTSQPNNHGHCDGVTLSNPQRLRIEAIDL